VLNGVAVLVGPLAGRLVAQVGPWGLLIIGLILVVAGERGEP
jgi:hypothetical protein